MWIQRNDSDFLCCCTFAFLRQKVRQLARESATKRAILSAATPEAAAAIAATAGASVEEQKKIKEQHLRILRQRQRLLLLRHLVKNQNSDAGAFYDRISI